MTIARPMIVAALAFVLARPAEAAPAVRAPTTLILGEASAIVVEGLQPGTTVRLHALRRTVAARFEERRRIEEPVVTHAWADFRADRRGRVAIDRVGPTAGTYQGQDRNGLLWSGWPLRDRRIGAGGRGDLARLAPATSGVLVLVAEVNGRLTSPASIALRPYSDRITFEELTVPEHGVSGVIAFPAGATKLPAVIDLHGSEGGTMSGARLRAGILAERGFAVLSLNYVAYGWSGGLPGVEPAMANVPVEVIDRARDFLRQRAEVDASRIALAGGSKGAELALVAASRMPWVRAVVACVPSDVVWTGYGREPRPGEKLSSWSWQGQPLPFIPYDRYEEVFSGKASAAEVHVRSRAKASAELVSAARIPVERIGAPVLLIAGGKDQVWPSAEMADAIGERMGRRAELLSFPEAGHGICGTGAAPMREDGVDGAADAKANGAAFARTIAFLREKLR